MGPVPEIAQSQSQKAVSELDAHAGRWELEAEVGDCGWSEIDKKQGQERVGRRQCRCQGHICCWCLVRMDVMLVVGS